jgi:hypothetical protein
MLDLVRFGCSYPAVAVQWFVGESVALRHPPTFSDWAQFEIGRLFGFYFESRLAELSLPETVIIA